jgi:hypothetical protein
VEYKISIIEQIGNTPLIKFNDFKGGFTPEAYQPSAEKLQIFAKLEDVEE